MQTLVDKTPRELARDYYDGLISTDEYRIRRRELIDRITGAGEVTLIPEDPDLPGTVEEEIPDQPAPSVTEDKPDTPAPAIGDEEPSDSAAESETKGFPYLPVGVAVLGLLLVSSWLMLSGGDEETPLESPAPVAQETTDTATDIANTDEVKSLVESFVSADDWSMQSLTGFILAWGSLSQQEQVAARAASWFQPLSDRLREQMLEQRALGDIGDGKEQTEREEILVSFAGHLGLSHLTKDLLAKYPGTDSTAKADQVASVALSDKAATVAREKQPVEQPEAVAVEPEQTEKVAVAPPERQPAPSQPPAVTSKQVADTVQVEAKQPRPPARQKAVTPTEVKPVKIAEQAKPVVKEKPPAADACPASLAKTRKPICHDQLPDGNKGPIMVVLPGGSFQMGSEQEASEQPVHSVQIKKPFAISAYEISSADYQQFCNGSGRSCPASHWPGELGPMVNVSWEDARAYVNWLSEVTGAVYRLPSEAEWEYAARGGTKSEYPSKEGDKILPTDARFNAASPLPVNDRSVNANGFRLRHMVGNVREWVTDAWSPNYKGTPVNGEPYGGEGNAVRVVRGGAYPDDAYKLRSSAREQLPVTSRDNKTGFRVVREVR